MDLKNRIGYCPLSDLRSIFFSLGFRLDNFAAIRIGFASNYCCHPVVS